MRLPTRFPGSTRRGSRARVLNSTRQLRTEPPPIPEGMHRCPVCRNVASLTPVGGVLRMHKDLFGYQCYNRSIGESK